MIRGIAVKVRGRADAWLRAFILRVGRRGAFLLFLTVLDVSFGYGLIADLPKGFPDFYLPLRFWGWAWLAMALVCLSGVPARRDIFQYTAASVLKSIWGMLYLDAWLTQDQPRAWISSVVWLSFAMTILLIAGWPEAGTFRQLMTPTQDEVRGAAGETGTINHDEQK